MSRAEKRKNTRIDSQNLISFVCLDDKNRKINQGIGRTLNVAEGGILIEVNAPLKDQQVISLTIALEETLMDFRGIITHSKKRKEGQYESGIQFTDMNDEKLCFLRQFITMFRE